MNDKALIQRNDAALTVTYTPEAERLKSSALELSGVVGKVSNAEENASAVAAQTELYRVKKLAEEARKAAKEPVLTFGKRIDDAAKKFVAEIDEEMLRVSKLIGDFQALEAAKARAVEQARLAEISRIEREKAEAIAKATSHEQVEAIQAQSNEQAAQFSAPPVAPVRAEGQVVKTDWEIVVTNPYELAKFHANCVTITPRLTEIKQLLNEGVLVKGITATKVTKASVRLTPQLKAIEV